MELQELKKTKQSYQATVSEDKKSIWFMEERKLSCIDVERISHITTDRDFIYIWEHPDKNGLSVEYMTKGSIADMRNNLPEDLFIQTHRQFLCRIEYLNTTDPDNPSFTEKGLSIGGKFGRLYRKKLKAFLKRKNIPGEAA